MNFDSISSIKGKSQDFSMKGSKNYLLDLEDHTPQSGIDVVESYAEAENKSFQFSAVDTLSSAIPPSPPEQDIAEQPEAPKPKLFSFDTIIDMGKKVWAWISSFFTTQKETEPVTGSTTEDGVQSISGSPSLETPTLVNKKMIDKMIQELIEQSQRIEESGNEAKDQNLSDEKRFIEYYKIQYELRKNGTLNIQFQFVFNQQKERTIRKEMSDLKTQNIELQKTRQFWGNVNTGLTVAVVAATVVAVAASIFATAGVALPAALLAGVKIMTATLGVLKAGSSGINAGLEYKEGKLTGKIEIIDFKQKYLNDLVRKDAQLTQSEASKGLENFVVLKQMLDNMYKTQRVVSSR